MGRGRQTGSVGGWFQLVTVTVQLALPLMAPKTAVRTQEWRAAACLAHPEGSHLGFRKPWPGGRWQVSVSVRAQQPRTWTSPPTGPRLVNVMNTPRNQNQPPHQLCLLTMKRTRKSFSADLNRLCSPALRAPTGSWGSSAHLRHGTVFCVVESVICDEQRSVTPPPQGAVSNYTHCSSIFVRTLIKTSPRLNPIKTQNVLTLIVKCVIWSPGAP